MEDGTDDSGLGTDSDEVKDAAAAEPPSEMAVTPKEVGGVNVDLVQGTPDYRLINDPLYGAPPKANVVSRGLERAGLDLWPPDESRYGLPLRLDALANTLPYESLSTSLVNAARISRSVVDLANTARIPGLGFSPTDSLIPGSLGTPALSTSGLFEKLVSPSSISVLGGSLDFAKHVGAFELPESMQVGRFDVATSINAFSSEPFKSALSVPGMLQLGSEYGAELSTIRVSTQSLIQDALKIPERVGFQVGAFGSAFSEAAGSLDLSTVRALGTASWLPTGVDRTATISGAATNLLSMPTAPTDVGGILAGFGRITTWDLGASSLSRLGSPSGSVAFREALVAELPSLIRYVATTSPATPTAPTGSTLSSDNFFVQLASAWVLGTAARARVTLDPTAHANFIMNLAFLLASIATSVIIHKLEAASSDLDADRLETSSQHVVKAIQQQTETIERLSFGALDTAPTHVSLVTVDLHAQPDGGSEHVGPLHPNQLVRVEAENGEWFRVTYTDAIDDVTRAGWVAKSVLRPLGD